jgi:DNA polymerase-4
MEKVILHIDFDSFFASVEQQHHPFFRGKPLGVTATNGRNCIIASSREAKKLGIGTASRSTSLVLISKNTGEKAKSLSRFAKIFHHLSKFFLLMSFLWILPKLHIYLVA